MLFCHPIPEARKLLRAKVGKQFPINLNHGGQILPGKPDHFVEGRLVIDDIDSLVLNATLIKPTDGFMAPAAIRLDEKANTFRFHDYTVREVAGFIKRDRDLDHPPM
jgi:hypothetical protein